MSNPFAEPCVEQPISMLFGYCRLGNRQVVVLSAEVSSKMTLNMRPVLPIGREDVVTWIAVQLPRDPVVERLVAEASRQESVRITV